MSILKKILHLVLLLKATSGLLSNSFSDEWSSEIALASIEHEHLSSSNYPSFAYLEPSRDNQLLHVQHLNEDRTKRNCQLQLNDTTEFTIDDLLSVPSGGLEIVALSAAGRSTLLVVDMSNCKLQRREIEANGLAGPFLAKRMDESKVDVFYQKIGDKATGVELCKGARLCRMSFDLVNKSMGEFGPFGDEVLGEDDFEIAHIGCSPSGYYFLSKKGNLASVDLTGGVLKTLKIYAGTDILHPWEFDYAHGYFGHCYVDMNESEQVRCLQTDASLRVLINSTYDFDDIAQNLSLHNTPGGGFWLLVRYCVDRCFSYKSHLTRAQVGQQPDFGKHVHLVPANQGNCDDYFARTVGFFESRGGQVCLIGRCYIVPVDYHSLDRHYVNVKCL